MASSGARVVNRDEGCDFGARNAHLPIRRRPGSGIMILVMHRSSARSMTTSDMRPYICTIVQINWCCQPRSALARSGAATRRPKSTILKGQSCNLSADADQFPPSCRHRAALSLAGGLERLRHHQRKARRPAWPTTIPAWAGGLPADAPPRPGTAKYDEFMRERERKRLMPARRGEEQGRAVVAGRRALSGEPASKSGVQSKLIVGHSPQPADPTRQSMNTTVLRPLRITRSSR